MFVVAIVCVAQLSLPAHAAAVLASSAGARLDSDLMHGGGTDDTSALQRILDRAKDGIAVHLVIDGPALTTGLDVHGNTTLECTSGGGLYLKDAAGRAIVRNAHRSRGEVLDRRIVIRNCFMNGNRWNQPSAGTFMMPFGGVTARLPTNKEPDGTFLTGLQFLGVKDLTLEGVTLFNVRAFGALIGNASRIDIRNVTVDNGAEPGDTRYFGQTDGLHFKGPIRALTIENVRFRTDDDALAFNANDSDTDDLTVRNDFGPYVRQGPITDVVVNNVQLLDAGWGIRFLSSTERIDRVVIDNVTGTLKGAYLLNIGHFMNPESLGNVGAISVSNVNVDLSSLDSTLAHFLRGPLAPEMAKEMNDGVLPFITVNAKIETLALRNILTKAADSRPILRFGPDADVRTITAELSIDDPQMQAVPVELDAGSQIQSFDLSLQWQGILQGRCRSPIADFGGRVERIISMGAGNCPRARRPRR